jgi:hypothetical protein
LPRLVQPYLRQCLQGRLESIETYLINLPLIFVVIVKPKIYFSRKLEELYSAKEEPDLLAKRPTTTKLGVQSSQLLITIKLQSKL